MCDCVHSRDRPKVSPGLRTIYDPVVPVQELLDLAGKEPITRRVLFLTGAVVFVDTMFFAALTPLLPHYAHRFELSKAGAGVLAAAYPAGVLVGGIPSGLLAVRIGVRTTASAGLALVAVTSVTFGFAGSIPLLDVARFLQGIGSACAWTAAFGWLLAVAPADRRGTLVGRTVGIAIVGALLGPVVGGIASLVGTRGTFSGVAALALAVVALALGTDAPSPRRAQSLVRLGAAFRDGRMLAGLWLVTLPALLYGTTAVLVPLRLSHLGAGAAAIGAVFVAAAALEATISPLSGLLADRRGRRRVVTISLVASAIGAAVLPWPDRAWLLGLVAVFAAASFAFSWAPAMTLLADAAERIDLDLVWAFALMNLAWAPGQALGSAGGGEVARATSDAVPFLALSAVCAATLLALDRLARRPV